MLDSWVGTATVYIVGFNFMIAFVSEMKSILKC